MTELSKRLMKEIQEGRSIREIGRRAGMSNSTVRRALLGEQLDHSTIEKFADYLDIPIDEVSRMSRESDGDTDDKYLSDLHQVGKRLPKSARAKLLSDAIRIEEELKAREGKTKS